MSERAENMIQRALTQGFGVEVEMTGITREKAARTAAAFLGTDRYQNSAYRNGYSTWSAWDDQGREWKFEKDVSIAGPSEMQCELVTPILHYAEDMETLQELIRQLRHAGAKSNGRDLHCGIHVHVDGQGHTPTSIRNLVNIMASHEQLLMEALDVNRDRMDRYCRMVNPAFLAELNSRKPKTMAALADIWYTTQGGVSGRSQRYNPSRYSAINLHSLFLTGSLEFRLFQFDPPAEGRRNGLNAGHLKAYVQLSLALSQMAKEVRTASPKPPQESNPCFAMRTWLVRMGFIGDEFKTARSVLTRKLSGDSAFRFGRRAA